MTAAVKEEKPRKAQKVQQVISASGKKHSKAVESPALNVSLAKAAPVAKPLAATHQVKTEIR